MDPLPDPLDDRVMKEILPPPQQPLSTNKLFPKNSFIQFNLDKVPDWKILRDHLAREGKLEKKDVLDLINTFISIVRSEPNIIQVQDPVTVVGDIHGQ